MAIKGKMTKFRIDELSGVDRPAQGPARAKIMKRGTESGDQPAQQADEGDTMSAVIKKALGLAETATDAEVEAALTKSLGSIATLTADAAFAKSVAALPADQLAHFRTLEKSDAGKAKAFMEQDDKAKAADVKKALDGEEVLTMGDATIRKSEVGDGAFAFMKAQQAQIQEQAAAFAKAQEATATANFTKAATVDYGHLAGTVADRVLVLKALEAAGPETVKAGATLLKAANATAKLAFAKLGHSDGNTGGDRGDAADDGEANFAKKAGDQLTDKANELRKADANLSFAKAYDRAARENPDLYAKAIGEAPAAE